MGLLHAICPRKVAFVIAATDHGTMIVNRFDYHITRDSRKIGFGVGFDLLGKGSFNPAEVNLVFRLLDLRRQHLGDGVVAIDCGANIGVYTVEWAKHMTGWGSLIAIEAQEWIYYALAGNIAINNCFNARAIHAAVAERQGTMKIPVLDQASAAPRASCTMPRRCQPLCTSGKGRSRSRAVVSAS